MRYIRHLDHFERACREEEAPIIQKEYEVQLVEDEKLFIAEQKRLAEVHRQAWEEDIKEKERLSRMADAKNALAEEIMSRRKTEFEALRVTLHFQNIVSAHCIVRCNDAIDMSVTDRDALEQLLAETFAAWN